jgi:hypothetical protein
LQGEAVLKDCTLQGEVVLKDCKGKQYCRTVPCKGKQYCRTVPCTGKQSFMTVLKRSTCEVPWLPSVGCCVPRLSWVSKWRRSPLVTLHVASSWSHSTIPTPRCIWISWVRARPLDALYLRTVHCMGNQYLSAVLMKYSGDDCLPDGILQP